MYPLMSLSKLCDLPALSPLSNSRQAHRQRSGLRPGHSPPRHVTPSTPARLLACSFSYPPSLHEETARCLRLPTRLPSPASFPSHPPPPPPSPSALHQRWRHSCNAVVVLRPIPPRCRCAVAEPLRCCCVAADPPSRRAAAAQRPDGHRRLVQAAPGCAGLRMAPTPRPACAARAPVARRVV